MKQPVILPSMIVLTACSAFEPAIMAKKVNQMEYPYQHRFECQQEPDACAAVN